MRDFFRGWKRKVGVVTLVMACVLAAGWMRSISICDTFGASYGGTTYLSLGSIDQSVCIGIGNQTSYRLQWWKPTWRIDLKTKWVSPGSWAVTGRYRGDKGSKHFYGRFGRFSLNDSKFNVSYIAFPYWSIVLPLTLLAACLLLSKPRPPQSTSTNRKIAPNDTRLPASRDGAGSGTIAGAFVVELRSLSRWKNEQARKYERGSLTAAPQTAK